MMRESSAIRRSPSESAAANGVVDGRGGRWSARYPLIDAWRGVAALMVVVNHVTGILVGGIAVMLFFVISGYCIAASVDSCGQKGLGFGAFMMRRVRRIYPPYLLSIAFWAATRMVKRMQTGENALSKFGWVDWLQNLTLTQWVTLALHPQPHPVTNRSLFVSVYWSLCYEEQFYLVMGLMLLLAGVVRASVLTMTLGLMGAGLIVNAIFPEITCGFFIEYWALFGVGVLVFHRLCRVERAGVRRA